MMERVLNSFWIQTNPVSDTWVDVTADVLDRGLRWRKGIFSSNPLERVAEVGEFTFQLKNDAYTGVEHRYTPGHANCLNGFGVRAKVKIVTTWLNIEKVQWIGWIPPDGINPDTAGAAARYVGVTAHDWMYFALHNPVTLVEIGVDQDLGQVGVALAALLDAQPSRTDTTVYVETFANTNDTVRENTTVYGELDKAAKSELGYAYLTYEPRTGAGDILRLEGRLARMGTQRYEAVPLTIDESPLILSEDGNYYLISEDGAPIVADSAEVFGTLPAVIDYQVLNGANYANRWLGKTYPRKVGSKTVLFTLNEPIKLDAGATRENLRVRYFVAEGYVNVSASDVSLTDSAMNSKADGTGDDLTADLVVDGDYGAADALLSLENTAEQEAWVRTIEISGDPIYIGDTVSQVVEIPSDDDRLFGKIEVTLDQKYQSDPTRTLDQITVLAVRYAQRQNTVEWIEFCANTSREMAGLFVLQDVGSRIPLVMSAYDVDEDYFVQGIETWMVGSATFCRMVLKPARIESFQFWKLGSPGYSELGATATLGIEQ